MKERFLNIYANLPIRAREEITFVDKRCGPMTFNVIYLEVKADTKLSKKILSFLNEAKII